VDTVGVTCPPIPSGPVQGVPVTRSACRRGAQLARPVEESYSYRSLRAKSTGTHQVWNSGARSYSIVRDRSFYDPDCLRCECAGPLSPFRGSVRTCALRSPARFNFLSGVPMFSVSPATMQSINCAPGSTVNGTGSESKSESRRNALSWDAGEAYMRGL
jgi:hypothetical protein